MKVTGLIAIKKFTFRAGGKTVTVKPGDTLPPVTFSRAKHFIKQGYARRKRKEQTYGR